LQWWRHCLKLSFVDNSGSLQVLNKSYDKTTTRLMCHLSTLACPKVLEATTRHLPNVLYADMIERSAVWPESFRKFGTNNLSIGLYFFPQHERWHFLHKLKNMCDLINVFYFMFSILSYASNTLFVTLFLHCPFEFQLISVTLSTTNYVNVTFIFILFSVFKYSY
jgi:hypothetical protein